MADLTLPAGSFLLPGAAALSEFQGYDGDCGQASGLAAAHVASPEHPNLSAENLNADVRMQISQGLAGANGAEPLSSVAKLLDYYHVRYDTFPYHEPFSVDWHSLILDVFHGANGRQPGPVVMQVANAQALPGDEAGVHYHFITLLGICPAGYYTADGDNKAAASGQLVVYSWGQLAAAQPCGLLVCHMPIAAPAPAPPAPPPTPTLQEQLSDLSARLATLEGRVAKLVDTLKAVA